MRISDWSSDVCSSDLIGADEVTPSEKRWLDAYFTAHLYPVLTPIAIDPAHPFPFIPNRGLCVVVELLRGQHRSQINGLIPIPALVDRFIRLPGEAKRFIRLEELLRLYFDELFPGFQVKRSEEHTSELQSLMRISYAVFCLKKK